MTIVDWLVFLGIAPHTHSVADFVDAEAPPPRRRFTYRTADGMVREVVEFGGRYYTSSPVRDTPPPSKVEITYRTGDGKIRDRKTIVARGYRT